MLIESPLIAHLDQHRIAAGQTLHAFAYDLGVTKNAYDKWRQGVRHPNMRNINRILTLYPELSDHLRDEVNFQARGD